MTEAKTGMVMALRIARLGKHFVDTAASSSSVLTIMAGYESGHVAVYSLVSGDWQRTYLHHTHTQPVLSLDLPPVDPRSFLSSSADAIIGRHPLELESDVGEPSDQAASPLAPGVVKTGHSGQQSLVFRKPDGAIFATAGWDGRVRVYDAEHLEELAVLKWHADGCYAVDFARTLHGGAASVAETRDISISSPEHRLAEKESDGSGDDKNNGLGSELTRGNAVVESTQHVVRPGQANRSVRAGAESARRRLERVQNTHWVAVGSKDGKVSLWSIY
jgi:WD40 repeat protein